MIPQKIPAKTEEKPKEKKYFTVKVESLVPATVTHKIFAETPEQALELLSTNSPASKDAHWGKQRNKKATVYQYQTNMLLLGPKEVK